jgi:hypothetical protein
MPVRGKPEIIGSMFAAYRSKDGATVESLLTDDVTFTSPHDDAIGKAALSRTVPVEQRTHPDPSA